jgi:hypothetical protein
MLKRKREEKGEEIPAEAKTIRLTEPQVQWWKKMVPDAELRALRFASYADSSKKIDEFKSEWEEMERMSMKIDPKFRGPMPFNEMEMLRKIGKDPERDYSMAEHVLHPRPLNRKKGWEDISKKFEGTKALVRV